MQNPLKQYDYDKVISFAILLLHDMVKNIPGFGIWNDLGEKIQDGFVQAQRWLFYDSTFSF